MSDVEIILTDKAKSKSFRLLSTGELKKILRDMDGEKFIDQENGGRHLLHNTKRDELPSEIIIVYKEEENKRIAITQMHNHGIRKTGRIKPVSQVQTQ